MRWVLLPLTTVGEHSRELKAFAFVDILYRSAPIGAVRCGVVQTVVRLASRCVLSVRGAVRPRNRFFRFGFKGVLIGLFPKPHGFKPVRTTVQAVLFGFSHPYTEVKVLRVEGAQATKYKGLSKLVDQPPDREQVSIVINKLRPVTNEQGTTIGQSIRLSRKRYGAEDLQSMRYVHSRDGALFENRARARARRSY